MNIEEIDLSKDEGAFETSSICLKIEQASKKITHAVFQRSNWMTLNCLYILFFKYRYLNARVRLCVRSCVRSCVRLSEQLLRIVG